MDRWLYGVELTDEEVEAEAALGKASSAKARGIDRLRLERTRYSVARGRGLDERRDELRATQSIMFRFD